MTRRAIVESRSALVQKARHLFDRPLGATMREVIDVVGLDAEQTSRWLTNSARSGQLFSARNDKRDCHYFLTGEAAKAGLAVLQAQLRERAEIRKARRRPKAIKPLPVLPARPKVSALEAFKKQTAVDPGVKVQRVPGYERMSAKSERVAGPFASAGIGVYPVECSAWATAASASRNNEQSGEMS